MPITFTLLFHLHQESEDERPSARAYDEVLALVRQADALPFAIAWFAEHHLLDTRGRMPAPLLMAVAAARETRRIHVGPCVLLLPLHHPLGLAEQVSAADLLCGGRFAVGVGSGGNPDEFAAFDVPLAERRLRFAEGLDVFTRALTGRSFSHDGAHYHVPEVALVPPPAATLPERFWVAASSPESATLAGRSGAQLLLARGTSRDDLRAQIEIYESARAEAGHAGGNTQRQVTRGIYVTESEADAWNDARDGIRRHYRRLTRYGAEDVDEREMARRGDFIVGTPDQCAEQIAALLDAVPITHLACDISVTGMPVEQISRSLELLGREVAPRLSMAG